MIRANGLSIDADMSILDEFLHLAARGVHKGMRQKNIQPFGTFLAWDFNFQTFFYHGF